VRRETQELFQNKLAEIEKLGLKKEAKKETNEAEKKSKEEAKRAKKEAKATRQAALALSALKMPPHQGVTWVKRCCTWKATCCTAVKKNVR
jgi:hypothetical protein